MLMSDSCRKQQRRIEGFTLLELMVVIGLISVISGVVFPGLLRLYDSVTASVQEEEIVSQINGLGRLAWETGRELDLGSALLDLPEGWQVVTANRVRYRSNGVCLGGQVQLIRNGVVRRDARLSPPYCRMDE